MTGSYNIISDIAGQYDALLELLDQMPAGEPISVGDMIDRGPKSYEVVEFFRQNGRAVLGNHEHMFLNWVEGKERFFGTHYPSGCYMQNGGYTTINQFADSDGNVDIPLDFIEYLRSLRQQIVIPEPSDSGHCGLIVTHAPIHPDPVLRRYFEYTRLWNRDERVEPRGTWYQVFGHNSHWDCRSFGDYAQCLDTHLPKLVGLHWPSMRIYEQEY
jgi:serine/threonine protein phosphatase 1